MYVCITRNVKCSSCANALLLHMQEGIHGFKSNIKIHSVFVCLNQKQHTWFGSAFLKMFI